MVFISCSASTSILAICSQSSRCGRRTFSELTFQVAIFMAICFRCCFPGGGSAASARSTLAPLARSEEHTSELQSLMRISYAVFCLKKKHKHTIKHNTFQIEYNAYSSNTIQKNNYTLKA